MDNFGFARKCMIKKNFLGGGRGGDTLKPGHTPYEQFLSLPTPCFKMFLERSLNDPPATPSPSTTPPPLKILIIH